MTTTKQPLEPIPQPPDKPIIGNVLDLSADTQVQDLMKLAREYGEIFYLEISGRRLILVSSARLVAELCDEARFDKRVWAPLRQVREFAGDGLFTAHTFEPNWRKAHNVLLPNFSMASMKRYHPMMLDIARQMLDKWARLNPREEVDVAEEMTRLTLDTIGLCGFDYRFNSFYRDRPHPFIRAMTRAMSISMDRSVRPDFGNRLLFRQNRIFRHSVELMNAIVDGIIVERKANPAGENGKADLLAAMLVGRDRDTGEPLDDLNIRYQIITFLIAGHETTSGLLSFALYFLKQNPPVLARAIDEVDRVLGTDLARDPTYREITELRYIRQILNESLRLWPTAPMFALFPKEGSTVLGDKYAVDKRDAIAVLTPMLHRDPTVWGTNADVFDPEHFAPEREAELAPHAFKPFGNGQRACIGRQFAMHEAALAVAMILQRFHLVDPHGYKLDVKETLTLKPRGFRIQISTRPRPERPSSIGEVQESTPLSGEAGQAQQQFTPAGRSEDTVSRSAAARSTMTARSVPAHGTPLHVLFGSNMGTAESLAQRLGEEAEARGYAVTVAPADHYAGHLPTDGPVLIATSSYNGTPPDNAAQFVQWLGSLTGTSELSGVSYAVFGCGNRDWAATYQRVPQLIDQALQQHGARRLVTRGEGDARGDFDGDFETWLKPLFPRVAEAAGIVESPLVPARGPRAPTYLVEVVEERHPNPFVASFGALPMVIVENRELQGPRAGRSTRHIELSLPPGVSYETGDHLGVVAANDDLLVKRVLDRFGYEPQTRIRLRQNTPGRSELPIDQAISAKRLLTDYLELQDTATRSQIAVLAEHTECPPDKRALLALCGDDEASRARYRTEVLGRHLALLDLLERHVACELPFGVFLGLLQPLRPRYYSISSSPRALERICSLTVGVLAGPSRSGRGQFHGVCSSYLARQNRGGTVYGFVRDTKSAFRLPKNAAAPLILIGPGTGIAPFRGFLQERQALATDGRELGPAILFFGCRHPDHDYLYREELATFRSAGIVDVVCAFSRLESEVVAGEENEPAGKTYVQHKLWDERSRVKELVARGAFILVCGDAAKMAPAVRETLTRILEFPNQPGSGEAAVAALEAQDRYLVDVWSSS